MQKLLSEFFDEIGLPSCSKGVLEATHKFSLKIYARIFLKEIVKKNDFVRLGRRNEMKLQFEKAYEEFLNESKNG